MGDAADLLTEQGMDAWHAHNCGHCEVGCQFCQEEQERAMIAVNRLPPATDLDVALVLVIGLDSYALTRRGLLGGWELAKQDSTALYRVRQKVVAGKLVWTCDCKAGQHGKMCKHRRALEEKGLIQ